MADCCSGAAYSCNGGDQPAELFANEYERFTINASGALHAPQRFASGDLGRNQLAQPALCHDPAAHVDVWRVPAVSHRRVDNNVLRLPHTGLQGQRQRGELALVLRRLAALPLSAGDRARVWRPCMGGVRPLRRLCKPHRQRRRDRLRPRPW